MFAKSIFQTPQHFIALATDLFQYPNLSIRQLQIILLKAKSPPLSIQYTLQFLKQKSIQSLALTICRFTSQLSDLTEGNSMSHSLQKHLSQSSFLTQVRHQITHGQMPSYQTIQISKKLILKNLKEKFWKAKLLQYIQNLYIINWEKVQSQYKRIYQKQYHQTYQQTQLQVIKANSLNYITGYSDNLNLFQSYKKSHPSLTFNRQNMKQAQSMKAYVIEKFYKKQNINSLTQIQLKDKKQFSNKLESQIVKNNFKQQIEKIKSFSDYKLKQYFQAEFKIISTLQRTKYSNIASKIQIYDVSQDIKKYFQIFQELNNFKKKMMLIIALNQFSNRPSSQFLYKIIQLCFEKTDITIIRKDEIIINKLKKLRFLIKIGKCQKLFKDIIPKSLLNQIQQFWSKILLKKQN